MLALDVISPVLDMQVGADGLGTYESWETRNRSVNSRFVPAWMIVGARYAGFSGAQSRKTKDGRWEDLD